MARAQTGELEARRWVLILIAILALLVGGTWTIVKVTTSYLLERDATNNARGWAQFLAANVGDLEQIAAGEQPSAASMAFFESTRRSGQVFRYVIFNRDGYSQLVSDRDRIALVDLSEFSPRAAESIKTGQPTVNFDKSGAPGHPTYFAEAYVPVRVDNRPVAIVAAYVAETEQRNLFYNTFIAAAASLCLLTALAFGVPAVAWFRQTKERQKADRRIRFMAHHDVLTGLLNRARFVERLEQALAHGDPDAGVAVHFVDLDHFKAVNDTFGHDAGDTLLKTLAERLRSTCREEDIVARLGGDEFVVAQTGVSATEQAEGLARRLLNAIVAPVAFGNQTIIATASIGIARSPMHGSASERLLKSADIAAYKAKASGRNCVRVFAPEMDTAMQQRLRLEKSIREATERESFEVHYQPFFDVRTRDLVGLEALLRLQDPDGHQIPPSVFIPVAEEMHLIGRIGAWVLRQACRTAATWPGDLKVAVNLSPAQFEEGRVSDIVAAALRESGLAPNRLELEITETLQFFNNERNVAEFRRFKSLGAAVVMDDFGTGHSCLSYLSKFPFDKIKVDRSFVRDLGTDGKAEALLKSIITLGHDLDLEVTIEGVETAEQLNFLGAVCAQQVQGYFLGLPMSEAEAARVVVDDLRRQDAVRSALSKAAVQWVH